MRCSPLLARPVAPLLAPPSLADRSYFLKHVKESFRGTIIFSLATPAFKGIPNTPENRDFNWTQLSDINTASQMFFLSHGVPVIDPGNYCHSGTYHLYADDIHTSSKKCNNIAGTCGFGQLTVAHLKLLASIVRQLRS